MPAMYVRAYSKGQKNDFRDAEAIAQAVQRPTMKFVATKTADQLDLQALHRVRERLVSQRTGVINQIRAFLLERGVAVRQGRHFLRAIERLHCRAAAPTLSRCLTRADILCVRMPHAGHYVLSPAISKENRRLSSAACAQRGSTPIVLSAAVRPPAKTREARNGLCSVSRVATVRTRAAAVSADIVSPE